MDRPANAPANTQANMPANTVPQADATEFNPGKNMKKFKKEMYV